MSASFKTPELRQFAANYISSVEQLEILALFQSNPQKSWTVKEIYRHIQSSEASVASCLEAFAKNGLIALQPDGNYRLSPRTPELARCIAELTKAYRERRVSVIEMIYDRPSDVIQDFADAFKLRKQK